MVYTPFLSLSLFLPLSSSHQGLSSHGFQQWKGWVSEGRDFIFLVVDRVWAAGVSRLRVRGCGVVVVDGG